MTKPLTSGAHHIGLTVPDLAAATAFFRDALGFAETGGVPGYPAIFVSDGTTLLTLWQAANPEDAVAFDRKANVGLHHLAMRVPDQAALATAYDNVRAFPGAAIEFAPEPMRPGSPTSHFICNMPGGIRIEFATPFA